MASLSERSKRDRGKKVGREGERRREFCGV